MADTNACAHVHVDGRECAAPRLKSGRFCYWHSPDTKDEAAEARKLGGLRRRREKTIANAFGYAGLGTPDDVRRVLEIAVLDALGLENSPARGRLLIAGAVAAAKLLESDSEDWEE